MVQLRGHQLTAAQLYELALVLRAQCQRYAALLIINDRLDVGSAVGADGFQLGKQALPLSVARGVVGPNFLIGASVHSLEEATDAIGQGADFLTVGTIFDSASHPGEVTAGPDLIYLVNQKFPNCPSIAIGGINPTNVATVCQAGAAGVAVISSILRAENPTQAAHELYQSLKKF
jgi:thiamine-phosphate pyrophosphorylase